MDQAGQSITEVLSTGLLSGPSCFCLKDIAGNCRINEMEFMFPAEQFRMSKIQKAMELSESPACDYAPKLSALSNSDFTGFLKGFIDLVILYQGKWYIIDYKSNDLGDTYDHYSPECINRAMTDHHYFLQYYIYTMALHRYLTLRVKGYDYDSHFGGVLYLFIRGMHPELGPEIGIFFDRPGAPGAF